jgi:hypothetical protein
VHRLSLLFFGRRLNKLKKGLDLYEQQRQQLKQMPIMEAVSLPQAEIVCAATT